MKSERWNAFDVECLGALRGEEGRRREWVVGSGELTRIPAKGDEE